MFPTKVANATEMKDIIADAVINSFTDPKPAKELIKMIDSKGINLIEVVMPYDKTNGDRAFHLCAIYMKVKGTNKPNEFIMYIPAEIYAYLDLADEYTNIKGYGQIDSTD